MNKEEKLNVLVNNIKHYTKVMEIILGTKNEKAAYKAFFECVVEDIKELEKINDET